MDSSFDPGALLSHVYVLPDGPRVRLRLAQRSDEPAIRRLLAQHCLDPGDFELRRMLRCDPRLQLVICATVLDGRAETVAAVGAISLGDTARLEPELLVSDERLSDGLRDLLLGALRGRAREIARIRAA